MFLQLKFLIWYLVFVWTPRSIDREHDSFCWTFHCTRISPPCFFFIVVVHRYSSEAAGKRKLLADTLRWDVWTGLSLLQSQQKQLWHVVYLMHLIAVAQLHESKSVVEIWNNEKSQETANSEHKINPQKCKLSKSFIHTTEEKWMTTHPLKKSTKITFK